MRTKDEKKKAALFEATVKTVNERGFAAASVSKIAKAAGVSPATLYIYHKNKEELLVSTYLKIKKDFSRVMLKNFDASLPLRDILKNLWLTLSDYISKNQAYFSFTDQFAKSPYHTLVNQETVEQYFTPIIEVLQRGIYQKIIKNVELDVLRAFMFYPLLALTNPGICTKFEQTAGNIESAFTLAWDAIKL